MIRSDAGLAYLAMIEEERLELMTPQLRSLAGDEWPTREKSIKQARLDYQNLGFVLADQVFHLAIRAVATPVIAKSSGRIFTLSCAGPVATSERLRNEIGPKLTLLAKNLQTTTMMLT
ncbi:hypothetical protein [Thioclava sp. F36-7]|uniref:hypothetical protein n=1 Tax=Rhodobacterales TaxID=204455 RepID=UPI000997E335|nr:hypothetical protein [Thioclava sp. F36-7]MBR9894395.1 hypothetical protein [bacterium]OOY07562.1 hypothetical protein BMI89_17510 [Thioclava sp. F36-7]